MWAALIKVLLSILQLWTDDSELCCQTLAILSSLGFTALSKCHSFICENIIKSVCSICIIQSTSSTNKAKDYASNILTYVFEQDDGACLVHSTGILEDLVNTVAASSNKDLHHWGPINC